MRPIYMAYSSTIVLSLIAACSGESPSGEGSHSTGVALTRSHSHRLPSALSIQGDNGTIGASCTGSGLSNPSKNPVMHGTVHIYLLWYGSAAPNVQSLLETYIPNLSESSYLAMNSIYGDSNGPTTSTITLAKEITDFDVANAAGLANPPYSLGTALTDNDIYTEIDRAIQFNLFPRDSNGIYFVLTDKRVSETDGTNSFCTGGPQPYCAWHINHGNGGTDLKVGFIGDPGVCGACQWNVPGGTPHDNQSDSAISIFTHELIESLTDPDLNAWRQGDQENGDLCAWKVGSTYTSPNLFGGEHAGTADLHLGSDDYLVQMDWINPNNVGAEAYGLPFSGQNFGYTGQPIGDWMSGSYKAQCSPGQPVIGVAEETDEAQAHSVLCGSSQNWLSFGGQDSSCYGVSFGPGDNVDGSWDVGFSKAECRTNEYVAGVAQTTSGAIDGIMCCPGSLNHTSCDTEVFFNQNSASYAAPDWDTGFYKGQCSAGKYVAGISATTDGVGSGHALLCCAP